MVDLTNKILIAFLFLCLSSICFANPFLIGEPLENNTDYYVLFIDDKEFIVDPYLDELFVYDLQDLKDGRYYIEIMAVCEDDEGAIISFYLKKDTKKKHIEYKLERDHQDSDIFDKPIKIKIKINHKPKKKDNINIVKI